jgi:hypothetical protein
VLKGLFGIKKLRRVLLQIVLELCTSCDRDLWSGLLMSYEAGSYKLVEKLELPAQGADVRSPGRESFPYLIFLADHPALAPILGAKPNSPDSVPE